jgi:hypothetical protein
LYRRIGTSHARVEILCRYLLVRWSDYGLEAWDAAYSPMPANLSTASVVGATSCGGTSPRASIAVTSDGKVHGKSCTAYVWVASYCGLHLPLCMSVPMINVVTCQATTTTMKR